MMLENMQYGKQSKLYCFQLYNKLLNVKTVKLDLIRLEIGHVPLRLECLPQHRLEQFFSVSTPTPLMGEPGASSIYLGLVKWRTIPILYAKKKKRLRLPYNGRVIKNNQSKLVARQLIENNHQHQHKTSIYTPIGPPYVDTATLCLARSTKPHHSIA